MKTKGHILLVEDNAHLGGLVKEGLEEESFGVCWVQDGQSALQEAAVRNYDLFLLDVMIPKIDGIELAKKLKFQFPITPIIFMSARSLRSDITQGYLVGADDYVVKPFELYHLVLKIQAPLEPGEWYPGRAIKVSMIVVGSVWMWIGRN